MFEPVFVAQGLSDALRWNNLDVPLLLGKYPCGEDGGESRMWVALFGKLEQVGRRRPDPIDYISLYGLVIHDEK